MWFILQQNQLGILLIKSVPLPTFSRVLPILSFIRLNVSVSITSLDHFDFSVAHRETHGSSLDLLQVENQFALYHVLKRQSFPPLQLFWPLCQISYS